jgi:hypothetical protein
MISYLLKKTFMEYCDRGMLFFAGNLVFMALCIFCTAAVIFLHGGYLAIIFIVAILIYIGSAVWLCAYRRKWDDVDTMSRVAIRGAAFAMIQILIMVIGIISVRFYFNYGAMISLTAGFISVWIVVFWFIATSSVFHFISLRDATLAGAARKSILLFIRNPFTVSAASLVGVMCAFMTVLFVFGIPFALALSANTASLLTRKDQCGCDEREWESVIRKESRSLGPLTLRNVFFPWKQQR